MSAETSKQFINNETQPDDKHPSSQQDEHRPSLEQDDADELNQLEAEAADADEHSTGESRANENGSTVEFEWCETCPFDQFMKNSPCPAQFKTWIGCMEKNRTDDTSTNQIDSFPDDCYAVLRTFLKCQRNNPEYFGVPGSHGKDLQQFNDTEDEDEYDVGSS